MMSDVLCIAIAMVLLVTHIDISIAIRKEWPTKARVIRGA
jgi:hypothetical protein